MSMKRACSNSDSVENTNLNMFRDMVSETRVGDSFASPVDGETLVNVEENPQLSNTQCPDISVGLEFNTYDEAWETYLVYARCKGFGIRRDSTFKSKKNPGLTIGRTIVCDREGKGRRKSRTGTDGRDLKRRREETRTGCKARMRLNLNQETGAWRVGIFDDNHNHEFFSPSEALRHRCNKKYSENITPLRPHMELSRRRLVEVGEEGVSIVRHLSKTNEGMSSFFFTESNEGYNLGNVFWADGRSRMAYLEFGDVVCFDVTYTGDEVKLPFAVFTGVNHHMQATLFGCAMLRGEILTEDTFVWVFTQWLKCMFDKAPGAIITDKDAAICNAIDRVFPDTRHCYNSSSINKCARENLSLLRSNDTEFFENYNLWLTSESIHESERLWERLKAKYDNGEIDWLLNMYEKREHWVPAYLRDVFSAGILQPNQQVDNTGYFDGHLNPETPLGDFLKLYYKAIKTHRKAEKDEDVLTMNFEPTCESGLQWEEQASRCYTRQMFENFRSEFIASQGYYKEKVKKEGCKTEYLVGKCGTDKSKWRTVVHDVSGGVVLNCSCAKFETEGMLCRHILAIMRLKQIVTIPDKYILRRWTIDARFRVFGDSYLLNKEPSLDAGVAPVRLFFLQMKQEKLLKLAASSLPFYNWYNSRLDEYLAELPNQESTVDDTGVGSNQPTL